MNSIIRFSLLASRDGLTRSLVVVKPLNDSVLTETWEDTEMWDDTETFDEE